MLLSLGAVAALAMHPSSQYVAAACSGSWSLIDVSAGEIVFTARPAAEGASDFTTIAFHPDGLLLATGTSFTPLVLRSPRPSFLPAPPAL